MVKKVSKLTQRQVWSNGHSINVGLIGNLGYINVTDNNIYPDEDSRTKARDLGYNTLTIPLMTREDLKDLRTAIDEVLKNSK